MTDTSSRHIIIIIAALSVVSACKPSAEQQARVASILPKECRVYDLGSYGSIEQMVAVLCEGGRTVTTNTHEPHQCGKTPCPKQGAVVTFEEAKQ